MTSESLVKNTADADQVKKAAEKEQSQRDKELSDIAFLLNERSGRRFLYRLLGECGVNKLSYAGENVHQTNFNEGMRNVGNLFLADIMEVNPEAYITMLRENQKGA